MRTLAVSAKLGMTGVAVLTQFPMLMAISLPASKKLGEIQGAVWRSSAQVHYLPTLTIATKRSASPKTEEEIEKAKGVHSKEDSRRHGLLC